MGKLISASRVKTVDETQKWQAIRDTFVSDFRRDVSPILFSESARQGLTDLQQVWLTRGFDAIICSVQAGPAILHGASAAVSPLAIGTILYNVVDSAVGVLPVTFVDAEKDKLTDEWRKLDSPGSKLIEDRCVDSLPPISRLTVRVVECTEREERTTSMRSTVSQSQSRSLVRPGQRRRSSQSCRSSILLSESEDSPPETLLDVSRRRRRRWSRRHWIEMMYNLSCEILHNDCDSRCRDVHNTSRLLLCRSPVPSVLATLLQLQAKLSAADLVDFSPSKVPSSPCSLCTEKGEDQ